MYNMPEDYQKKLKKLMKNKNFVFCITVYPVAFVLFLSLFIFVKSTDFKDSALTYTVFSFLVLGIIAVVTIFERVEKRATYKVQGDKLKLKRSDSTWKA
jgi:hypothetical protein